MEADHPTTLVLSRKTGERIHIGDDITIEVKHCQGRARLAITAPRKTRILRGELYDLMNPVALPATERD